jgi:hypothetical protein
MAPWDVTYIGLRAPQPDYGDRLIDGEFEWGYEGAGPRRLAQAVLNDFFGFRVDVLMSNAFLREVIAHLPSEFELTGAEIAGWVSAWRASSPDAG